MKKTLLSLVAIATISFTSLGQSPEGFKYQAVVRDASSNPMTDQAVGMQITIQQGAIGGTAVYQETFAPTTNGYGLVNLEIGTGTSTDDFSSIDWSNTLLYRKSCGCNRRNKLCSNGHFSINECSLCLICENC